MRARKRHPDRASARFSSCSSPPGRSCSRFAGSVIPDRVMFASDRGLFDEVTLENYRFIFTGELPPAYLQSGANRTMISDAARQAPRSLWNSAQIALAALAHQPRSSARRPPSSMRATLFPGKRLTFMFLILSPLVPTIALITPIYMMLQAAGLIGSKLAHHPRARDQGAALHRADPLGLLPQDAARAVRGGGDRRLHALAVVPADRGAAGAARRWRRPASSPSCSPMRSSCSPWCFRATPRAARRRWSWRRSRAIRTSPGACSTPAILIAILPTILLVVAGLALRARRPRQRRGEGLRRQAACRTTTIR